MKKYRNITPRMHYIDVFRGLLMVLVVLGHSIGNTSDPINKFILSFHMPAFFILSGMCFAPQKADFDAKNAMKRKARGLVWPYVTFSLIGVSLYWLMIAGTPKDVGLSFQQTIVGIFWNDGVAGRIVTNGFWFVYDLIWISLLYILTKRVNRWIRLSVSAFLFLLLYYGHVKFYFFQEILRISVGFMFFTIGDLFAVTFTKKSLRSAENWGGSLRITLLLLFLSLLLTIVISQNNFSVLMYENHYGNVFLFICSSLSGTFSIFCLAIIIKKNSIIEFIGRKTLLILLFHFYVLMASHVLLHKYLPKIDNYQFPFSLLHFIITIVVCMGIAEIVSRYLKWLLRYPR